MSLALNGVYSDDFDELLDDNEHNHSPLILLMGPRGSGKTSIQQVLFNKLSPHETNFVESTTAPYGIVYPPPSAKANSEALLRCRIIDFPGGTSFQKQLTPLMERLLQSAASIVYVIDASFDETWAEASENLIGLLNALESLGLTPFISVLLHKIDPEVFSNDSTRSTYTDLRRALIDDLRTSQVRQSVTFYVTSLFDTSIYETFSRIIQQLLPQVNLLEHLLDGFDTSTGIERVFLVDLHSKLYLATDSSTPDVTLYELLSDLLDLVFDLCTIYSPQADGLGDEDQAGIEMPSHHAQDDDYPQSSQQSSSGTTNEDGDCCNADIKLNNSYVLRLRQLNGHLALLFASRKSPQHPQGAPLNQHSHQRHSAHANSRPHYHNNDGLVEYNVTCLKQAICALFNIEAYGIPRRKTIGAIKGPASGGFSHGSDDVNYGILSYMGSMASTNTLANMKNLYSKVGTYGAAGSLSGGGMSYINPASLAMSPSNLGQPTVGSSRVRSTTHLGSSYQPQSTTMNGDGSGRQKQYQYSGDQPTGGSYESPGTGLGSLRMVNHTRQGPSSHDGGAGYDNGQRYK